MRTRTRSRLLWLAAGLLALLLACAAATAAWLSRHPLSLAFLTPSLETALSSAEGGLAVSIGRTELVWVDWTRGPRIHAFEVRAIAPDGSQVIGFREIEVELAGRALWNGSVAARSIELIEPVLTVVREADGSLAFDLEQDAEDGPDSLTVLSEAIDSVIAPPDPAQPISYLEALRVREGALALEDRSIDATWRAPRLDLEIESAEGGLRVEWALRLDLGGEALNGRGSLHYDVASRSAEGTLDLGALAARASAMPEGDATRLRLAVTARDLAVGGLGSYWPPGLADGARSWVVGNIRAGTLPEARFELTARLGGGEQMSLLVDTLRGSARAEELVVHYLDPLPPARGVGTSFQFDRSGFVFDVSGARIEDVEVPEARVAITGLDGDDERLAIAGHVLGPLATLLRLLEGEPLELLDAFDLDPDGAEGRVDGELEIDLPLADDLALSQVAVRAHADLTDVFLDPAPGGIRLESGQLTLDAHNEGLRVAGTAVYSGRPAAFDWSETFRDEAGRRIVQVDARLPGGDLDAPSVALRAYGQSRDGAWLRGDLRVEAEGGGRAEAHYTADGGRGTLEASGNSIGRLLEALSLSERVTGGTFVLLAARPPDAATLTGEFSLTGFEVGSAPVLVRMLEALSFRGLLDALSQKKRLRVERFDGAFAYEDGTLRLSGARAVGKTLALTVDGDLHFGANTAELRGTVISMTNIANGIGAVPLVGRALTRKDGGLFGADYRVSGPLDDPQVEVKKLSQVLVPDWLSKLAPAINPLRMLRDRRPEADPAELSPSAP